MPIACHMCNLTKQSLIFTECQHFLCLSCALLNSTSEALISLKCCKIVTWLQEESRLVLETLKQEKEKTIYQRFESTKKEELKRQAEVRQPEVRERQMEKTVGNTMAQEKENIIERKSLEQSIFITNQQVKEWKQQHQKQQYFSPKKRNVPLADRALRVNEHDNSLVDSIRRETSLHPISRDASLLPILQSLLTAHLQSIKHRFELKHLQLSQRQDAVVRQMCECYTQQISLLGSDITQDDVNRIKNTLERVSELEIRRDEREREQCRSRKKQDDTPDYLRNDKILQKLEYNQQRMRERLNKHYIPS